MNVLVALLLLLISSFASALEVDKLLKLAEKWEVPQPHKNSKVVKIWAYSSGNKSSDDYYLLGFVEPTNSTRALVGFELKSDEYNNERWKDFDGSLTDVVGVDTFRPVHGVNEGLITGIQLIRHGQQEIGIKLIEKSLKEDAGHAHSPFHIAANLTAQETLARSCLSASLNEITTEKPDFKKIKQKLELLIKDNPKLKSKATDFYLEALTANVNHAAPAKGSIEEVVENYLMSGGSQGLLSGNVEKADAEKILTLKGFKAIPILLNYLDDKRMTNHLMVGFNNFVSHPMSAKSVVNNYLQAFTNNEMGSNWLERQKGIHSDRERITQWWKTASALGEKKYVEKYTLVSSKDGLQLSSALLMLAVDRYPELIPSIYQKAITSKMHSWPIAEAFANHPKILPEIKIELLTKAIATGKEEHRNAALRGLISIKSEKANIVLIKLIKEASNTTKEEYWTEQNAYLALMVSKSNNIDLWHAIIAFITRADLGMRMELISKLRPAKNAPKEILALFFQVYDLYKNDITIRDESSSPKFDGPGAGFPYQVISVRDFIHMHYAHWLKIKISAPDQKKPLAPQWQNYRSKTQVEIKRYRKLKDL